MPGLGVPSRKGRWASGNGGGTPAAGPPATILKTGCHHLPVEFRQMIRDRAVRPPRERQMRRGPHYRSAGVRSRSCPETAPPSELAPPDSLSSRVVWPDPPIVPVRRASLSGDIAGKRHPIGSVVCTRANATLGLCGLTTPEAAMPNPLDLTADLPHNAEDTRHRLLAADPFPPMAPPSLDLPATESPNLNWSPDEDLRREMAA